MPPSRRQLLTTLVLIAALVIIVLPPLRTAVFENRQLLRADRAATQLVEEAFTRALASFALARATNAVISVIQESEVSVSPAGIGLTLALGQVLDPLNDLVERFSWVMLVALTSLGIQRFLIEISPWLGIQLLGSLTILLWIAGIWLGPWLRHDLVGLARRLLVVAIVVRFAVPLAAGLNELVYQHFLAERYAVASQAVAMHNAELEQAESPPDAQPAESWWRQFLSSSGRDVPGIDFSAVKVWLKQYSSQLIDSFLDLVLVFLLNTVILPIVFLWGISRLFKAVTGTPLLPRLERTVRGRIIGADATGEGGAQDRD
jgi:hypothetical protein